MNKNTVTDIIVDIVAKVIGILICVIGIGIWYADYLVFRAIGAICEYLASWIGITGATKVGVMIIGWFFGLGLMVTIFVIGAAIYVFGVGVLLEEQ